MRGILAWVSRHLLLDVPTYIRAQEYLSEKIEDSVRSHEKEYGELGWFVRNLDGDAIQRHLESAAQRLRSIEDKARANLLGITIGIAVLFSGFTLAAGGGSAALMHGWIRALLLLLFAIAVCYLLTGGIMALEALRLRPVFMPSIREDATANKHMRAVQAVWAMEQNERTAMMRTNALSVSFDGIRNGVVCIAIAVVLLVAAVAFAGSDSPRPKPVDDPTPKVRVDSLQPTDSTPNQLDPETSAPAGHPSVVEDSAALTEAVDTLP